MTENQRQELLDMECKTFTDVVERHRRWSIATFGQVRSVRGILAHIMKEVEEVRKDRENLKEWIDIITLGIEGAWRSGHSPKQIVQGIYDVQNRNIMRDWPPIGSVPDDQPIEHIRTTRERIERGEISQEEAEKEGNQAWEDKEKGEP